MKNITWFLAIILTLGACTSTPPTIQEPPTQTPVIVEEPKETTPSPIEEDKDVIGKSIDYEAIASEVDRYNNSNQLNLLRGNTTFAKSIHQAVKERMKDSAIPLDSYLTGLFNLNSKYPVSLNERLCPYTQEMAQRLLRTSISNQGLDLINRFVDEVNNTDALGREEAYTRLMMCLAYSESLGDPDTSRSDVIASREGVTKHPGVKFYFDSLQTNPDSQINIGLYQFSPIFSGNINPCLRDFGNNERNRRDLVNLLGAQDQEWNARCGMHKVMTLFFISKNTTNNSRKAGNQCVALHNRNAYNHFGPLQREANPGGGFTKLYNCYFGSKQ